MRTAYYIDTYSKGNMHEMFDASSLLIFSKLFDVLYYRADKSSKRNVEYLLKSMPKNINYKKIYVPTERNKYYKFVKQIFATILNCFYIIKSKKTDFVIINYNTMLSIYPINIVTKLFEKKVLVICHGEMYDLQYKRKTSFLFRKSKLFFLKNDISIANGLFFAVLGDFVINNLRNVVSENVFEKFISIDHTFIDHEFKKEKVQNEKIKIGIIGSFRQSKGINDLIYVVNETLKVNSNIEFQIIGSFDFNKDYLLQNGFTLPKGVNGSFLTRSQMLDLISNLDFALYLLPVDIYKFTASGSFFDAINCEVPIIALRNDFMDYYKQKYGKFGYLFDDKDDIINMLSDNSFKDINVDFETIKKKLNPDVIANEVYNSIKLINHHKL